MKRIIFLLLALLLLLSSCVALPTPPSETDPPAVQDPTGPTGSVVTDPTETDPTDAPPTDAPPTDAPPTEPDPTDAPPTEPDPTEPPATEHPTTPDDPTDPGTPAELFYVHFIDVGQGDCIFVKLGDCDILIDAGKPQYGSTVVQYLNDLGVDDIELMVNTHPDNDHYGGLPAVLDAFVVEAAWGSSYAKSTSTYVSFLSKVSAEGISLTTPATGSIHTYGDITITVVTDGSDATNSNDSSIVLMVEYGDFRFLLTGDISSKIETKLISSGKDLTCDVLKVGHHGSKSSSSADFLAATQATYGVICVGAGNSYGHPTSDALSRLSGAGIDVYRTDLNGHIVFSSDGETLQMTLEKDAA